MVRNAGLLGCFVVLALAGARFMGWPVSLDVVRFAAVLVLVGTWIESEGNSLLFSPLFVLAAIVIGFYSVVPALFLQIIEPVKSIIGSAPVHGTWLGFSETATIIFIGSEGEAVLLSFAVLCLVGALIAHRFADRGISIEHADLERLTQGGILWSLVGLVGVFSVFTAIYFGLGEDGFGGPRVQWLFDQVQFVTQPLLSLAMVVVCAAIGRGNQKAFLPLVFLILLVGFGVYSAYSAKYYVFITFIGGFSYITYAKPSLVRLIVLGSVLVGILFSALSLSHILRGNPIDQGITVHLVRIGTYKLALRQGWTGYCFENVLEESKTKAPEKSPAYFLSALVPRVIWKDKPPLTSGHEYGMRYCRGAVRGGDISALHSSSITLLGEPLEKSGMPGLVVAVIIVVSGLSVLTWFGLRQGVGGAIFLGALTPWVMDFDQQFTMYLAHLVKAMLVLTPFLVIYIRRVRQGQDP